MVVLDEERVACSLRAFPFSSRPEHLASHTSLYVGDADREYAYCVPTLLWSSTPMHIAVVVSLDLAWALATAAALRRTVYSYEHKFPCALQEPWVYTLASGLVHASTIVTG